MSGGAMRLPGAANTSEQASAMVAGCQQLHEEGAVKTPWPALLHAKHVLPQTCCLASTSEEVGGSHAALRSGLQLWDTLCAEVGAQHLLICTKGLQLFTEQAEVYLERSLPQRSPAAPA